MTVAGQLLFGAFLLGATWLLVRWAARHDPFLRNLIVVFVVAELVTLGLGILYLEVRHGRRYLAPDEVAYLEEARRLLEAYRRGEPFTSSISGGYVYWNAVVLWFWQTSALGAKLANIVVAAGGVAVAYLLSEQLFGSRFAARVAAVATAFTPSLMIWSVTNLKDRPLGVLLAASVCAGAWVLHRWRWRGLFAFAFALLLLGALRHYYAPPVGWLFLALSVAAPAPRWRTRALRTAAAVLVVGVVLDVTVGTFLAVGMRHETARRYVTETVNVSAVPRSALAESAREPGGTAGRSEPAGPALSVRLAISFVHVLFDRFHPVGVSGRLMTWLLLPEWLASFVIVPLAVLGTYLAARRRLPGTLLVAGTLTGLLLAFAYVYGDPWTAIRFRSIVSPLMIALAAGPAAEWLSRRHTVASSALDAPALAQ